MDPVTAITAGTAAVSIGASIFGGVTQAAGQQESGEANAAMYRYKAGVALLNKQVNEQNAQWARDAGDLQAEESGLKSKQEIAQTKANQGASGLDVNTGSNLAVTQAQQKVAAFDQNVIRWNAAKTAYGYETKAVTDEAESNLDTFSAQQSKIAGGIAAAGSYINTAGSVASKWMQAKSTGMFGGSGSDDTAFEANIIA